jgi:hypothetical protein
MIEAKKNKKAVFSLLELFFHIESVDYSGDDTLFGTEILISALF